MAYKISIKVAGKWLNVGNFKENKFGNMSLGLIATKELKDLINSTEDGKWFNLAAFEDKPKEEKTKDISDF